MIGIPENADIEPVEMHLSNEIITMMDISVGVNSCYPHDNYQCRKRFKNDMFTDSSYMTIDPMHVESHLGGKDYSLKRKMISTEPIMNSSKRRCAHVNSESRVPMPHRAAEIMTNDLLTLGHDIFVDEDDIKNKWKLVGSSLRHWGK